MGESRSHCIRVNETFDAVDKPIMVFTIAFKNKFKTKSVIDDFVDKGTHSSQTPELAP